ncbi:MAG: 3-deoxy-manno-octulosonate cytidylyltransferase [Dissulfuribacterales bacterium]
MRKKCIVAIIPARMGSSRFPGKPMAQIHGIPMIGHVYFRTKMCPLLHETYVATCDQEIFDYVISIGGKAVMTADTHERCSDRTAEAMLKIESEMGGQVDIVVMVQGDEPMITPEMIEQSVTPMVKDSSVQVVNLMARIKTVEEFEDPNEVKVVTDLQSNAIYFSREPIPSRKKGKRDVPMMKQVCIIPFKREFLLKFNKLQPTPLEIIESVDMMRVIEHGYKVKMAFTDMETYSVDTPEDLAKVEKLTKNDLLIRRYAE